MNKIVRLLTFGNAWILINSMYKILNFLKFSYKYNLELSK